jgi:hypothetical protein
VEVWSSSPHLPYIFAVSFRGPHQKLGSEPHMGCGVGSRGSSIVLSGQSLLFPTEHDLGFLSSCISLPFFSSDSACSTPSSFGIWASSTPSLPVSVFEDLLDLALCYDRALDQGFSGFSSSHGVSSDSSTSNGEWPFLVEGFITSLLEPTNLNVWDEVEEYRVATIATMKAHTTLGKDSTSPTSRLESHRCQNKVIPVENRPRNLIMGDDIMIK